MSNCELCNPATALCEDRLAYASLEKNALNPGHVIVVPRRHVADFFAMTGDEQASVMALLRQAREIIQAKHRPDGYNIGANVGAAAGQSRMHVHFHLIPRYRGDVENPKGGIRCVLTGKK